MSQLPPADDKYTKSDHVEDCNNVTIIDDFQVLGLAAEDANFYREFSAERRKKVLRKVREQADALGLSIDVGRARKKLTFLQVDIRLVPMLSILYLVSHLDRANIGNAKIAGLTDDLGLSGIQYNIALSLFFIPYVLLGGFFACFNLL